MPCILLASLVRILLIFLEYFLKTSFWLFEFFLLLCFQFHWSLLFCWVCPSLYWHWLKFFFFEKKLRLLIQNLSFFFLIWAINTINFPQDCFSSIPQILIYLCHFHSVQNIFKFLTSSLNNSYFKRMLFNCQLFVNLLFQRRFV